MPSFNVRSRMFLPLTGAALALLSACGDSPSDPDVPIESERLESLVLMVPGTLPLGQAVTATVDGVTASGSRVRLSGPVILTLFDESRVHADLAVATIDGARLTASGPGSVGVVAHLGALASNSIVVTVPRLPIVTGLEPTALPPEGGMVRLDGYDLDGVATVAVDGVPTPTIDRAPRSLTVAVPAAPDGCRGRGTVEVTVPDGFSLGGPHRLRRPRPDEVVIAPGTWRHLPIDGEGCILLPSVPGAEYALAYFDTRGIQRARGEEEPTEWYPIRLEVADQSVAASGNGPRPAHAPPSTPEGAASHLLRTGTSSTTPDHYYADRDRPWAPGDTVAIPDGAEFARGTVFYATSTLAFATLERNDGLEVRQRLRGVREAASLFEQFGAPAFSAVFGTAKPATTSGSGQMLMVVADWTSPGAYMNGDPTSAEGSFVVLDPGVGVIPRSQPLYLGSNVVVHELAHAWQFRFLYERCESVGDCAYSAPTHAWALEGGAELLTEYVLATAYGYSFDGNHPLRGILHNVYGAIFWAGTTRHYRFGAGYASASWLLRDFVHRATGAGSTIHEALGAVARGALQGWYGFLRGTGSRPGLTDTLRELLGPDWDPEEAVLLALVSLAADDRTAEPSLQSPWLRDVWEIYEPALTFELGSGAGEDRTIPGATFAYYRILDDEGLGGSVRASTEVSGLSWALVRIR